MIDVISDERLNGNLCNKKKILKVDESNDPDLNNKNLKIDVRYVDLCDKESEIRKAWLEAFFASYSILSLNRYDFNTKSEIILSTGRMNFDMILLGGKDASRIVAFLDEHSAMMRGKAKIGICLKSDPRRRAKMLMAGCDDVIDLSRTGHAELFGRLSAIWSRYVETKKVRLEAHELERRFAEVTFSTKLPPKFKQVLTCLLTSRNLAASHYSLLLAASSEFDLITIGNLKVTISGIRKLLRPGVQIRSEPNSMYRLIMPKTVISERL